ncbi:hypothetical protein I4U23_024159 [Adineta vaga]|nr:hypothetical protein I4U23_024159 [Adineta vaga]
MSSFISELEEIRRILFELNNHLMKISAEIKEQTHNESEDSHLVDIKQTIRDNLRFVKDKLISLPTTGIDDESIPLFHSTLNQLESLLEKIRSIPNDDDDDDVVSILQLPRYTEQLSSTTVANEDSQESIPIIRMNRHPLERKLKPEQETEMNYQPNFYAQLSIDLNFIEEQLHRLKTISDERYQRKLREVFTKLQSKYDNDCESYKQQITIYTDLKEYSKYCVEYYKSRKQSIEEMNRHLKVAYRRKLQDDLQFQHYFHIFLVRFQKDLFQMILNESKDYLPRSENFRLCLFNDKYYNLYADQEQLTLIYQFVGEIFYSISPEEFYNLISIKTPYLELFFTYINSSIHASHYLNELKEFYLVYVRDSILNLRENQQIIESNERIQSLLYQMKIFNEQSIKIIQDSERMAKNLFIRQFRGKTWDEKLIHDQLLPSQQNPTNLAEDFDAADHLTHINDLIRTSDDLFQQSIALKEKKPSLKLYFEKSIELLNESISMDESIIQSSMSNAKDQLRNKIEYRALIYLDMANKYVFPCFEKFNCFNQSKYDFIRYDKQTKNESNVQFNEKNFINLFKQAFEKNDISSLNSYNKILQINPYFFEAQYQKLLKFYELNDCEKLCHINQIFEKLSNSETPVVDLFSILIHLEHCRNDRKDEKFSTFFNKLLKIKVKNNQHESLYLHFSRTQYSNQVKFNNEKQLINLLKYGPASMIKLKKTSNKSLKLKYQLSNFDFKQFIRSLINQIEKQESYFLELIKLFKALELVNENKFKNFDEKFRKILPETRFNLIKCTIKSNHCQTICEISKSIKEFEIFEKQKNSRILQLKFQRAKIYRANHYFYLEELEFSDILNYQTTNRDHNPMIYYRLSYLSKLKDDLQMAIH